ncbi:MAG: hypothetical protein HONBIEJF_02606 [Fimbriimonadaceae bacterium]|nr:hypothetical protein [Fimbriimonadaceae bacterium]
MKARLSMAFEDLRGKNGTVVISKSRNGLALRPFVIPTNPNTQAQEAIRSYLTKAARTFKALSAAQVQAWRDYALTITLTDPITGEQYHPTAINAFIELATKFLQNNPTGSIPQTPPASPYVGDNVTVTATAGAGKVTFTASAGNSVGTKTELLLQRLPGANRKPSKNGYRSKGFFQFLPGTLSTDVTVPPGSYVAGYRFINTSTGQVTEMIPIPAGAVTFAVVQGGEGSKKKAA